MNDANQKLDLIRRAKAAYWKFWGNPEAPEPDDASVENINGLEYVVLRGGGQNLAVYRHDNLGRLKKLRRIPQELKGK